MLAISPSSTWPSHRSPTNFSPTTVASQLLPPRLRNWFGMSVGNADLYHDDDGNLRITVDLPGFDPDDIDIQWHNGRLTITAAHTDDHADDTLTQWRSKNYHQTFQTPDDIEPDAITAEYQNGVLDLTIPLPEDAMPDTHQIEINT